MDDQGTKRRRKIAENFNWLSRVHERYRRQTDDRRNAIAYRERSLKILRAVKNYLQHSKSVIGKTAKASPSVDFIHVVNYINLVHPTE